MGKQSSIGLSVLYLQIGNVSLYYRCICVLCRNPLNWTSETVQDMAPYWNLLSKEEIMIITEKVSLLVLNWHNSILYFFLTYWPNKSSSLPVQYTIVYVG